MTIKLLEGMWAGDLADLVQPLISVDEYESKLDDDAMVVGFFVNDEDAANDLNRFIQKSPIALLDCDVSPAPDQRGYYIVFVELSYNDRLVSAIAEILEEIAPLVSVENWQMRVRGLDGLCRFDAERLGDILKANRASDKLKKLKGQIALLKAKLEQRKK